MFFWLTVSQIMAQNISLQLKEGEISPDELLLKEYTPRSQLVLSETPITRAKYQVVDVHMHPRDERGADEWVEMARSINVRKTILLGGALGDQFIQQYDTYVKPYPEDFLLFCGLGRQWFGEPDYSVKAVKAIEEAYKLGARGIGEIMDKGMGMGTDYQGRTIDIDHPMFDAVWEKCVELGIPINIHIFDPPSFYEPLDKFNEQFLIAAKYHFYGKNIHDRNTMINKRNSIMDRHPKLVVIGAHMGNSAHNLAELGRYLDKYPNFYVDLSARSWEYGRQPNTARKFITKYQDKIFFGTDLGPAKGSYLPHFRLLETDDDGIEPQGASRGWQVHGLNLPDKILRKLYYKNAERVIPGVKK